MEFINNLPKMELHAHLNGSLGNATLGKLYMAKYGKDPLADTSHGLYKILHGESLSLEECFKKFGFAHDLTDREEFLALATRCVIEDFAADNVVYLELRTTPKATDFMSKRTYFQTVLDVLREASKQRSDIMVKLLPSIDRKRGATEAMENVNLAIEFSALYPGTIVGMDLSGNPLENKFSSFVPALEKARAHGFRLALHCGEFNNTDEVQEMLAFGVDRIGHGTFIEGEALAFANTKQIPFECCLTSNVKCSTVASYEDHHFLKLFKMKQPICVCTDDFGVFETTLSRELEICAQTFHLSNKDLIQLQRDAIEFSFANEQEKRMLRAKIDQFEDLNND